MIRYTVQNGDSLWRIAQNYNISLESLIAANPQITDPNFILAGSVINIPVRPPGQQRPGVTSPVIPYCDDDVRPCIYVAEEGDTLESISRALSVSLSMIVYYNLRYGKREPLPRGSRIIIPEVEGPGPRPPRPR